MPTRTVLRLVSLLVLGCRAPAARAQAASVDNPIIRVGIVRTLGHPASAIIGSDSGFSVVVIGLDGDMSSPAQAMAASEIRAEAHEGMVSLYLPGRSEPQQSAQAIEIAPQNPGSVVSLRAGGRDEQASSARRTRRPTPPHYRGVLRLSAAGGRLTIINSLPLDAYLRGVAPAEMPSEAPPEALKAQAVASRTFALMNGSRYNKLGYDVDDTTMSQVYAGVDAEQPSTDAAVRDTAGQVLTRDGRMFLTDFYDDCGGVTAPADRAGDFPPAVLDGPDERQDYCARGAHHEWTVTLGAAAIAVLLPASERSKIGAVTGLEIPERDVTGRVVRIVVRGEHGVREMSGASFRAMLGYETLKSTLFKVNPAGPTFVFEGRGYGHGRGMCQAGAMGMAAAPYRASYRDILSHYYPGTQIAPLSSVASQLEMRPATLRSAAGRVN